MDGTECICCQQGKLSHVFNLLPLVRGYCLEHAQLREISLSISCSEHALYQPFCTRHIWTELVCSLAEILLHLRAQLPVIGQSEVRHIHPDCLQECALFVLVFGQEALQK